MIALNTVESFLSHKELAFCGASRNPKKFGRVVYDTLKERGFKLYPVHPFTDEIAEKNDITIIHKQCIMKFAEPVSGIHKFHRSISKLFGALPK